MLELASGNGAPEWTSIGQIVVHRGLLYLTQPQDHSILVIDAKGALVRRIGRKGSGPGEFRDISAMGMKADTLWVHDYTLDRVTFLSPMGAVHRTTTLEIPDTKGMSSPAVAHVSDGGDLLLMFAPQPGDAASDRTPIKISRKDGSAQAIGTMRASKGATRVPPSGMYMSGDYTRYFGDGAILLADGQTISVLEGASTGLVTQQEYRYDGTRGTTRQFTLPVVRVPTPLIARLESTILASLTKAARSAEVARSLMPQAFPMPANFPVLLGAHRLPGGELLLRTPSDDENLVLWQLLDGRGAVRPLFTTTRAFRPTGISAGRIWGTVKDADGLDVIVAYAIPTG